ncbi:MAG: sigma-70 family RNA polymerase sigma factor [Clostridia bacterium]|nr:sigma-70 family RNA polymerase sigma factor [Clostridia bacterium]
MADTPDARGRRITDNLGLVHACAARFRGRGVEYDDLFQAGCVGLVKAADRFDPARGCAFSTYAVPVILGEIRALFRQGGALRIGRTTRARAREAMACAGKLADALGRQPTVTELANALALSAEETAVLVNAAVPVCSLTQAETQREFDVPDESDEGRLTARIALRQAVEALPAQDRALLRLRYGQGLTQTAAAQQLGMTQVQVSRREKRILQQLRSRLED